MREGTTRSIRLAAWANMALGALALLSIMLAKDRQAALWSAGFVGFGLLLWGAIEAWAATSGHLRGTKVLAMFMAVLGIVLAGSSFLTQDAGPFRWATIGLGALVLVVSVFDAVVSPDEDRRAEFEPRRPDDVARRPLP
ncbi:MAG TPA: hypothetical protein VM370_03580 [Candidatus Thermoplasmatota archaeon]|nr:hypothetical protein [Candidatus Thermoplasmatota archaeon]